MTTAVHLPAAATTRTADPAWLDVAAYPFRRRTVDVGPGRMHFVDEGDGPPILFVHGTPTWSFEYRHLVAALRTSWRCVAPDHLGFGLSDRPAAFDYTPERHADALAAFVDEVGLRDFVLVVHDFGGPIGLPLALAGRARAVVVLNSWMWSFADDPLMRRRAALVDGALGRFLYRRLNASLRLLLPSAYGDKRKLTKAVHAQYLRVFDDVDARERVLWTLARSLRGSSAFFADLARRAGALAGVPVLIVWGEADSALRPYLLERWRALVPHADVVALPGVGHWPHEEAPAAVIDAITTFLATSAARTPSRTSTSAR